MEAYIDTYGPLAVFFLLMLSGIGVPIGEDLINIPAGILVGNGELPLFATLIAAYLGVVCSDTLWFYLCRRYGTHLLHRRWFKRLVHPRRLLEAKHQVELNGAWVIVMARFIPGSRTPTITIAGLLQLPIWQFVLATASCVLITAPLQIGLGYLIALGIGTQRTADLVLYIFAGVAVIAAVMFAVRWWRQHHPTQRRLPRSRAAWLRRLRPDRLLRRQAVRR
jgi:membrane protein DedA with SNARE-associated domain